MNSGFGVTWKDTAGAELPLDSWRFARVLRPILGFALAVHLAFVGVFYLLDIRVMLVINVLSVALYTGLLANMHRFRERWILTTGYVTVLMHVWLATHFTGWGGGFHLYALILIPLVAFLADFSFRQRCLLIALISVFYALVASTYMGMEPLVPLDPHVLGWLKSANFGATCIGLSVVSLFYAIAVNRADRIILQARRKLEQLASTDPLTGFLNRRSMEPLLRQLLDSGRPVAVLLADLDHFKVINDELGHDAGDQVLEAVGAALRSNLRASDYAARWGGEEFLMVFPNRDLAESRAIADRLRTAVAECWVGIDGRRVSVTIGIAMARRGESLESVIKRADNALLEGKRMGRNRAVLDNSMYREGCPA